MKKRHNTTKKQNSNTEHRDSSGYIEQESTDKLSVKSMWVLSVASLAGGLLGLYLLLGTSITDAYFESKLKQNTIYAKTDTSSPSDNSQDIGVDNSQDDDDDNTGNGVGDDDADDTDKDSSLDDFFVVRPTEIVIDREDLIDYLGDISDDEFETFIQTMVDVINEHTDDDKSLTSSGLSETHIDLTTLQEAYERAEKEYPNQIDGSKRIQLINELNAIDYDYYVVEHGDTLSELSQVLEVPMGQFVELNGVQDANKISVGEVLLVPLEYKKE